MLHTPLMSGTNAIHGIVDGRRHAGARRCRTRTRSTWIVGFVAVVLGAANLVGGFVVTDRMLEMFKGASPRRRPTLRDGQHGT